MLVMLLTNKSLGCELGLSELTEVSGKQIPISNTCGTRSVPGLHYSSIVIPAFLVVSEAFLTLVLELEQFCLQCRPAS